MAALTYFTVTGTYLAALKDSLYDVDNDPELTPMSGTVTLTPILEAGDSLPAPTLTPPANLWLVPVKAQIKSGVITTNGAVGVKLVANTAVLGLSGNLFYRVDFYDGLLAGGHTYHPDSFTFQAPTTATTVDLVTVTPLPGSPAVGNVLPVLSVGGKTGAIILTADDVSDAGPTGKALTRAADQASAWTALGQVPNGNLPDLALIQFKGAKANQAAMLATSGEPGDWVTRSDTSTAWIITGSDPTQLGSWTQLPFPSVTWSNLSGMPAVVGAGATQAEARQVMGLPVAGAAVWAPTVDLQAAPTRPGLVMKGDSFTANSLGIQTWNGSSYSRTSSFSSQGFMACAMVWNGQPTTWTCVGVVGQTAAQGLANFDATVTALKPQVVGIEYGSNDMKGGRTAVDTFADLRAMYDKAWAFGANVIGFTCPPRDNYTTGQMQEALKLNQMLRSFAATNPARFALVDLWAVFANPTTGNFKSDLVESDGTHPNTKGCWLAGKACEAALDQFFPAAAPNLATANVNEVGNLAVNPLFITAGGTAVSNKGVSGDIAGGWLASSTGTDANLTSVFSRVARTDGRGYWQQITTTTVPSASAYVSVNQNIASGFTAGSDIVQAVVDFETDAAGWTNGLLDLTLSALDGSDNCLSITGSFNPGVDAVIGVRPEWGVLRTPPIVIPTGTTHLFATAIAGATGTVRFGCIDICKLPTA